MGDERGFSLIELIIAMAMSAIVMLAVLGFMSAGTNGLQHAEANVSVQSEAQIMVNHITQHAMESSNAEFNTSRHTLKLVNSSNGEIYKFWWNSNNLYIFDSDKDVTLVSEAEKEDAFLGANVVNFSCTIKEDGSKKALALNLKVTKNKQTQEIKNTIWFRNQE